MKRISILAAVSTLAIAASANAQSDAGPATGGVAPESAVGTASQAPTQDSVTQTAPSPEPGEIIVTAQRRSENLQKVPIAITVVQGAALKANNFTSVSDVQYLAPSLQYVPVPQSPAFSIRGVGVTGAFDYSVEPSVGVSLDDVIQTLPRVSSINTLSDVDRIEVLRGPQGTLFGKNTTAGLVSIVTRKPELGQYSNEGHVQFGSRNEVQAYDIVNLPITDTLAARFRAAYQTQESVLRNVGGHSIPDNRDTEFNGKVLWEPSDKFTVYAIGDYQKSNGDPGIYTIRNYGAGTVAPAVGNNFIQATTTALGIVPGPDNNVEALGGDSFQASKTYSGQVTATLQLGTQTLTSITAYKHLDYLSRLDVDSTPLTVLDNNQGSIKAHQITQEIRLSSPSGHKLEYVIGGFYYNQELSSTQIQAGGLGFLPTGFPIELSALDGQQNFGLSVHSYAGFGQLTYRPVDRVRLIAGARYTYDKISSDVFISEVPNVCGYSLVVGVCHATALPTPVLGGETKHGDYSGRVGPEFDVTPHLMVYGTVSRGYKGAGIATVSGTLNYIKPETVLSEEIGIKSQFFDRKLTLNVALFHSKYHDFQAQVFDPSVPPTGAYVTGNAGGLRSQGVEVEFGARPIPGLSLSGGVNYVDAKFTNYQPACYAGQTAAQGCTLPGPTFDASGDRLIGAPRWTYTLSGAYERPISERLKGFANINWSYRSSVFFGVGDPNTVQKGYGLMNLSVGVADANDHVRLSVFARNLLDKRFTTFIFPTFFDAGGYSQIIPDAAYRRIGVALDYKF